MSSQDDKPKRIKRGSGDGDDPAVVRHPRGPMPFSRLAWDPLARVAWRLVVSYLDIVSKTNLFSTNHEFKQWGDTVWDDLAHIQYGAPKPWVRTRRDEFSSSSRYRAYAVYERLMTRENNPFPLDSCDKEQPAVQFSFQPRHGTVELREYSFLSDILAEAVNIGVVSNDVLGVTITQQEIQNGKAVNITVTWEIQSLDTEPETKKTLIEVITRYLNRKYYLPTEQPQQLNAIGGGICSVCNVSMCYECFETHKLEHQ